MIKKILVAADLGPFTSHMLLHLDNLVACFDARVHVVHVVPPIGDLASAVVRSQCSESVKQEVLATPHITGLLETIREEIYEAFADREYIDGGLLSKVSEVVVAPGQVVNVILEEAERARADMIVVGSHGSESIDGRILGSVAAKVLQLSRVPVLMLPMMNPAHMLGSPPISLPCRSA